MASQQAEAVHSFHWHYDEFDDKNFELHGHNFLLLLLILALILLCTLLCLYARWLCRRRQPASSSPSAPPAPGLHPDTIARIPVHLYSSLAADDVQCSICLGNLVDGEKVKVLPGCSHWFHQECVDEWLRARPSCPLCRAPLGVSPAAAAV